MTGKSVNRDILKQLTGFLGHNTYF